MKVLFTLGSFFPSQQGGPCNSVYYLAKALAKRGVDVKVITTSYDIDALDNIKLDSWIDISGIKVFYIKVPESIFLTNLLFLLSDNKIKKVLTGTDYDISNPNVLFTVLPHIVAIYGKYLNKPIVWSPRGSLMDYSMNKSKVKKKVFLSIPFIRESLNGAYFHTTAMVEKVELEKNIKKIGISVKNIYVLPNIIENYCGILSKDIWSKFDYGKYILYLGRIHPKKKIENLIEGYNMSKFKNDYTLVIAGDTTEVPEYTNLLNNLVKRLNITKRVIFTNKRIEGEEKNKLYRNADLFILASESENFAMVIVEALSNGCPVIVSNKLDWKSVEEKGCGFWVGNDPLSISIAIDKYFSLDPNTRESMRIRAFEYANEFNSDKFVDKYIEMYEDILRDFYERR